MIAIGFKKRFLTTFGIIIGGALLFNLGQVKAQTHYNSNVSVGVKAGMDLSRVNFTPGVKQSFLPGANAGFTIRYIEENHFGLIGEINFEQRGWKENFEEAPFKYSRTLNYIQIPFLAHIYFGRRARFFFNAGPEIGFMIGESTSSNFDYKNVGAVSGFPNRTTYQYLINADPKVDYGISAGLGGEFNVNRTHSVYLEGRFYYGLGNVLKSGRTERFRGSNSMSIMISAGYWFRIK
ncbi:MAG: PorT family protein [Muribaculaceae bacterium]|nr:PorT family protein [Muribaculaceae bacterium]